jgi:hypothetical protein
MEMTGHMSMANAHETGNSTDDVETTTTEEELECPSKVPRLKIIHDVADCNKDQKPLQQHRTQTRSSSQPRHAPCMSHVNLDDLPTPSQLACELKELKKDLCLLAPPAAEIKDEKRNEEKDDEAVELMPSTSHNLRPASPPSSQRRFFTPDGDYARMALALHLSRRTAALEEIRQRYRPAVKAGMEEAGAQPPEASSQPEPPPPEPPLYDHEVYHSSPPSQESTGPGASQESYGGDWVDDVALELLDGWLHPAADDSDPPQ